MKRFFYMALLATCMTAPAFAAQDNLSSTSTTGSTVSAGIAGSQNLTRNNVLEIQQALASKGYYSGSADGIWGPMTTSALRRFQSENQLNANGSLDTNTLNELGVDISMNSTSSSDTGSSMNNSPGNSGVRSDTNSDMNSDTNSTDMNNSATGTSPGSAETGSTGSSPSGY